MPQDTDSSKKLVTLKVYPESLDVVKDQQEACRKARAPIPTQAQIAELAFSIAVNANWQNPQYSVRSENGTPIDLGKTLIDDKHVVNITVSQEFAPWVSKLVTVMSGPARRAIEENLKTFEEYTELKGSGHDPTRKAVADAEKKKKRSDAAPGAVEKYLDKRNRRTGKRDKTA